MKPIELWMEAISQLTLSGNIVYEPCSGSGTTHISANNTNRKCYGIEISPDYCAVILQRMTDAFPGIKIIKE
jgi:DNA modification methylase